MCSVLQDVHYRIARDLSSAQFGTFEESARASLIRLASVFGPVVAGMPGLCRGRKHRAPAVVGAVVLGDLGTVEHVTVCTRCFESVCVLMAGGAEALPGLRFIVRGAA